jgi:hypothetical protein
MANELLQVAPISGIAGADLTGMEGRIARPTSTGWVLAGLGQFGLPIVVGGASGRAVTLGGVGNIHRVIASATVTAGAFLKSHTDGTVRDAAATSVSAATVVGSYAVGIALTAGVANGSVEMLTIPMGLLPTTAA